MVFKLASYLISRLTIVCNPRLLIFVLVNFLSLPVYRPWIGGTVAKAPYANPFSVDFINGKSKQKLLKYQWFHQQSWGSRIQATVSPLIISRRNALKSYDCHLVPLRIFPISEFPVVKENYLETNLKWQSQWTKGR